MLQVYEMLIDFTQSFPNIHNLVDALCPDGLAQLVVPPGDAPKVSESLSSQLDALDAAMVALTSKMAVIDKVEGDEVRACLVSTPLPASAGPG